MTDSEWEDAEMENNEIRFKVTLELDAKWASNLTAEEMALYIQERLNSSLGFRGQVKKFKIVSR